VAYESDAVLQQFDVSTLAHYKAVGRPTGQDFPNGTFTTTTFGAWTVEAADPNDNVVGSLYGLQRQGLPAGDPELQAYQEAAPDQGTTTLTYLDPLGRPGGTLAQGGSTAADRRTVTQLDIAGAVLQIIDPRNLTAFIYERDMLGRALHEVGLDAGETRSLPDALDLLVVCAEAGLSLDMAITRVGREMAEGAPELADEFAITAIELGFAPDRQTALQNLVRRTDMQSLRALVNSLAYCERYGTPIANALRVLAAEFRDVRMMRAEEKAAKLPALMTVPMILFILPTLFMVIGGPAAIQVIDIMAKR